MGTEDALFADVNHDLTLRRAKKFGKGSLKDWAEQSHKLAQKVVYGELPKAPAGGQVSVNAMYEVVSDPVIQAQIERAGARLATLLNTTFK